MELESRIINRNFSFILVNKLKLNSLERLSIDVNVLTKFNWIGRIQYDENWYMSIQLMEVDRPLLDLDTVSLEDMKKAYVDYTAYYGRYSIDEKNATVTHHVEGSWYKKWMNEDLVRHYKFEGNTLELNTTPEEEKGTMIIWRLIWEKII